MPKYVVEGWCPPALARLGDTTYIVPGYIKVPASTTLQMITWKRPVSTEPRTYTVPGKDYIITDYGTRKTCTCPGYTYRKTCRHLAG
jgi:hypothetical protein